MNTLQMDRMVYTLEHFMKVKDFGIIGVSYASCGPTSSGGGLKVSGQDGCVAPSHYGLVPSCHAATFYLALNNNIQLYKKRGQTRVIYSIYI
jgi:hypothetical protein